MSINADYDFYSDFQVRIKYEPVTTAQSNSTSVSSVSNPGSNSADHGRYKGAYENRAISMASLSNAVQS